MIKRPTKLFHALIHFPGPYPSQAWVRPKLEAWDFNQISHMEAKNSSY